MRFDWDRNKAEVNQTKHGVRFEEAKTVFGDPLSITSLDLEHSHGEIRYTQIGCSSDGRVLIVIFAEHRGYIRIISARVAKRRERLQYEEGQF